MLTGTTKIRWALCGIWGADTERSQPTEMGEPTKQTSTGSKQPGKQEPRDRAANRAGHSGRSERLLLLSAATEHPGQHHVDWLQL